MPQSKVGFGLSSPPPDSVWVNGSVSVLVLCVLLVAYLDLAEYWSVMTAGALLPKYIYFALAASVVPLLFLRRKILLSYLGSDYIIWLVLLALLNLTHLFAYVADGNAKGVSLTMTRIQYLVLAALLGFLLIQERPAFIGRMFVLVALFLTALQVSDFLFPGAMVPVDTEGVVGGRASSTLINPNKAAESLILLTVLGMPFLRPIWRIWLLLFIFPGVLLSFSRSGLIAWALIVVGGFWFRIFPRSAYFLMLGLVTLVFFTAENLLEWVLSYVELSALDDVYSRLLFFSNFDTNDFSALERIELANDALESFFEQPITGNGAGFSYLWPIGRPPHNQHLLTLVDYGMVGYVLFAWLLFLAYRGEAYFRSLQSPQMTMVAFAIILFLTVFTNNMFDSLYWLITLTLICQRKLYFPK